MRNYDHLRQKAIAKRKLPYSVGFWKGIRGYDISLRKIAKLFDTHVCTVLSCLKKLGLHEPEEPRIALTEMQVLAAARYYALGESTHNIAKRFGKSQGNIYKMLVKAGYKLKTSGQGKNKVCKVPECGEPCFKFKRKTNTGFWLCGQYCKKHHDEYKARIAREVNRRKHNISPEKFRSGTKWNSVEPTDFSKSVSPIVAKQFKLVNIKQVVNVRVSCSQRACPFPVMPGKTVCRQHALYETIEMSPMGSSLNERSLRGV